MVAEKKSMKYLKVLERILQSGEGDTYYAEFYKKKLAVFRKVAVEKARSLGFKVNEAVEYDAQWDGETLNVKNQDAGYAGADHPGNIIHEIGHWAVCASKARRSTPDYGLGPGPDSDPSSSEPSIAARQSQVEEERASLLGILMELELGFPAADTLRLHEWAHPWSKFDGNRKPIKAPDGEWSYDNAKGFTSALNWLVKKNLCSIEGEVNWAQVSKGVAR
jgi:hypothetical protein